MFFKFLCLKIEIVFIIIFFLANKEFIIHQIKITIQLMEQPSERKHQYGTRVHFRRRVYQARSSSSQGAQQHKTKQTTNTESKKIAA